MKRNRTLSASTLRRTLVCLTLWLFVGVGFKSQAQHGSPGENISPRALERAMNKAWKTSWSRFYHPDTDLFYDYITSYNRRKSLAHLPTRDEVEGQIPNGHGYDTGMEDCMISAGVMLVAVVDRYAVTGERKLAAKADDIVKGIRLAATIHGSPGFVARGVTIDGTFSTYPGTSRDQVTHAVHGLWYYYNSPLCSESTKGIIREVLDAVADRMKRNVTVENNHDFLRPDGTCEPIGLQRMWKVAGHEAARLPMIFAAAWNATGNEEYYRLYQKYLREAIQQSQLPVSGVSTWGLVQMQFSMELLGSMEKDEALTSTINAIMHNIAVESRRRASGAWQAGQSLDLTTVAADWRLPDGGIKGHGTYRKIWYAIRQSGEGALAQITAGPDAFSDEQRRMLAGAITRLNYNRVSSNGIYYLQAAYWKARKAGIYQPGAASKTN